MNDRPWTIEGALEFLRTSLVAMQENQRPSQILVIEDDTNDVDLLLRRLAQFDCEVTVSKDPEHAQEVARSKRFDYVLIDQVMPKITGFEFIQRTRGVADPDTRWVMVTGAPAGAVLDSIAALDAVLLRKPVSDQALHTIGLRRRKK